MSSRIRQIILDTETTGIGVEDGHRVLEIGCLEMIDRKLTGNSFHYYLNPEREVEAGALQVHGISNEFLQDKPLFKTIAWEFVDFIAGAELIIHNAPFDVAFLNNELMLTNQGWKLITDYCGVIDTLRLARQLHVGQRNSLDALCKRYGVDLSKRDLHGALMDAKLLAQVYLAMTGGQGSFFDSINDAQINTITPQENVAISPSKTYNLTVLKADAKELLEHEKYLQILEKHGKCAWLNSSE